jgi:anti-sigma regulatory factor (Ser/Thr protein kinase)
MVVANGPRAMEVRFRFRTDAGRISTAVDRILRLVELSGCVRGEVFDVELALREARINAMLHGNRMNPDEQGGTEVHLRKRAGRRSRRLERASEPSGPRPFVHGLGSHREKRAALDDPDPAPRAPGAGRQP